MSKFKKIMKTESAGENVEELNLWFCLGEDGNDTIPCTCIGEFCTC